MFIAGASAALLLLQAPKTPGQAIADYTLNVGSMAAIAQLIEPKENEE